MANEQNLIKAEDLTSSELRERARKGGKASAQKRREKKLFKELFDSYLEKQITNEDLKKQMKKFGFEDKECTNKNAMVFAQYSKALKGSTQAFIAVRDTIGEKPKEQIEHSGNVNNPFEGLSTEELRKILNDK